MTHTEFDLEKIKIMKESARLVVGKSSLVNKILGSRRAVVGEGFVTNQVKPYELSKYPFIYVYF
jgi:hypothetical protein